MDWNRATGEQEQGRGRQMNTHRYPPPLLTYTHTHNVLAEVKLSFYTSFTCYFRHVFPLLLAGNTCPQTTEHRMKQPGIVSNVIQFWGNQILISYFNNLPKVKPSPRTESVIRQNKVKYLRFCCKNFKPRTVFPGVECTHADRILSVLCSPFAGGIPAKSLDVSSGQRVSFSCFCYRWAFYHSWFKSPTFQLFRKP